MLFLLMLDVMLLLGSVKSSLTQARETVQEQGINEIADLHRAERRAHFDHDIEALLSTLGPSLIDVREGQITRMSREDVRRRFTEYFHMAKFSSWDDLEPPIIRVSPDGQMAWMIVRVRIVYTQTETSGKQTAQHTTGAWMAGYEKRAGKWLMVAVSSTFQAGG